MKMKIGDKIVEVDNSSGVPVIKATAEEIRYPDGRVDVIVKVPCLRIAGSTNKN
jgi:hypothetical protein